MYGTSESIAKMRLAFHVKVELLSSYVGSYIYFQGVERGNTVHHSKYENFTLSLVEGNENESFLFPIRKVLVK